MGSQKLPAFITAFVYLLAPVVTYFTNILAAQLNPLLLMLLGCVILATLAGTVYIITAHTVKDKLYYGFTTFAFTSGASLMISLEVDGYVNGFVTWYIQYGEPYLLSPWGSAVSYFDGIVFYLCYVLMAYLSSNGKDYHRIGLFYTGAIMDSMVVLLIGGVLSHSGFSWCSLLEILYVVFPLVTGYVSIKNHKRIDTNRRSTWLDKILAILLLQATLPLLFRGLASLGCHMYYIKWFKDMVEPIINQTIPAPFASVQGVTGLVYFLPICIILSVGLIVYPGKSWLQDLALILAGASSMSGATQFIMMIHPMTSPEHGIPPMKNHTAAAVFWASAFLTFVLPLIIAIWLCQSPATDCYLFAKDKSSVKKGSKSTKQVQKSKKKTKVENDMKQSKVKKQ